MPFIDIDCTQDLYNSSARSKHFFESEYALSFEETMDLITSGYVDNIENDENVFDIATNGGIFKYFNIKDPQLNKLKMYIGDDCLSREDIDLIIIPTECMASGISQVISNNNKLFEYFNIDNQNLIKESAFNHFQTLKNKTIIKHDYDDDYRSSTQCDKKLIIKYLQRNFNDYKIWLNNLRLYTN